MRGLFSSQELLASGEYRCADGSILNLRQLPSFIRVLLTTNGTVTRSLEAYFLEAIDVKCTRQEPLILEADVPFIERVAGDEVIERNVKLTGKQTGRVYAKASSLINLDLLPSEVQTKLIQKRTGIGEVLLELGIETYREIMELGMEGENCVWRQYRIIMNHHPIMQITEYFPLELYRD